MSHDIKYISWHQDIFQSVALQWQIFCTKEEISDAIYLKELKIQQIIYSDKC